jgi:hypothetical protein
VTGRALCRLVDVALAIVCAGSLYQLAVGLKLLDLGELPGDGPPLDSFFFFVPVYVLVLGGTALALVGVARGSATSLSRHLPFRALPVAAAAFPLCRAAAFDPYYLPSLIRFNGVALVWLIAVAALGIGVAVLCVLRPGMAAIVLTGIVMVVSGVVAVGEGLH